MLTGTARTLRRTCQFIDTLLFDTFADTQHASKALLPTDAMEFAITKPVADLLLDGAIKSGATWLLSVSAAHDIDGNQLKICSKRLMLEWNTQAVCITATWNSEGAGNHSDLQHTSRRAKISRLALKDLLQILQ